MDEPRAERLQELAKVLERIRLLKSISNTKIINAKYLGRDTLSQGIGGQNIVRGWLQPVSAAQLSLLLLVM